MSFTQEYFADFVTTTVNGGAGGVSTTLNPSDTSLYVPTGGLALMPGSVNFRLLIGQPIAGSGEIVLVTATGSNPLTIVRAQEGTSAGTWPVGTNVQLLLTATQLANMMTTLALLLTQSSSVATPSSSGTINTSGVSVARVNPSGAVTGMILQSGSQGGQQVQVLNESANSLTFAASGTSHVADGVTDVIQPTSAKEYIWDSGTSLWYPSGGGGGASTSDHFILGMGGQNDSDLSNGIVVPGFSGSPDARAGGANDDEFDYNSASTPTGWTTFGGSSPAASTNSFLSHVKITAARAAEPNINGIYKSAPSIPFTATAKISDGVFAHDYANYGLFILDGTTTGKMVSIGPRHDTGEDQRGIHCYMIQWSNWTTDNSHVAIWDMTSPPPVYVRLVCHAANNIDGWVSFNGMAWEWLGNSTYLSNATYIGLGLDCENASNSNNVPTLFVDWIRFS